MSESTVRAAVWSEVELTAEAGCRLAEAVTAATWAEVPTWLRPHLEEVIYRTGRLKGLVITTCTKGCAE